MTVVFGIVFLGILVLVHEAGHFASARACAVTVESFSIGMGPVILHKTLGATDYRLSLIPFGGYCAMKGEKKDSGGGSIPADSFYGVHPIRRICIALAGPAANILFAVAAFTVIGITGYTFYSADNRIILADEIYPEVSSAARTAGLASGDRIITINGTPTPTFADISREISVSPEKALALKVDRAGTVFSTAVTPVLDKASLTGKIGVTNWVDPIIAMVEPQSSAEEEGLKIGDTIIAVDGIAVDSAALIQKYCTGKNTVTLSYARAGDLSGSALINLQGGTSLGIGFSLPPCHTPRYNAVGAVFYGIKETARLITLSLRSMHLVFRTGNLTSSVSGPVRITFMLGDTARTGFSDSFNTGLVNTLSFMALISVSLFLMNLLPIPVLDGGLVLFALTEWIAHRPLKVKIQQYVQYAGIAVIAILVGFAFVNDITYLLKG